LAISVAGTLAGVHGEIQTFLQKSSVNTILQQAQPPTPNITKEQHDNSIMVLPADRDRASVILESETHHAKMSALIDSGPYQLLNKDQTDR